MRIPFRDARLKPMVVGAIKYSSFLTRYLPIAAGATNNSRYCYAVWMRHLIHLSRYNNAKIPGEVLELGPGDSLGAGLASLLSGASQYWALEVIKYWNIERNLRIFDELVTMFRNKTAIPDHKEFPRLRPYLDDYSFPDTLITDEILKKSLDSSRLDQIRSEISSPDNIDNHFIQFKVPWNETDIIEPASVDYIFSQAVLQHIKDIDHAFIAMQTWLSPSGFMSHVTDYSSLGFTKTWNGHWTASDWEWKLMEGGRGFSTNRLPHSEYLKLHEKYGFKILFLNTKPQDNNLQRGKLVTKYRDLSDDDLQTYSSFIVSCK